MRIKATDAGYALTLLFQLGRGDDAFCKSRLSRFTPRRLLNVRAAG